jgi:hypothetical protein
METMTMSNLLRFAEGKSIANNKMIVFEVRRRPDGSLYTCNEFATEKENNRDVIIVTHINEDLTESETESLLNQVRQKLGV